MRAPWTVLRDANAELRRERDERAELIALRKERIVLRTMLWTGYGGLILIIGWGAAGEGASFAAPRPVGAVLAVAVGALVSGGVAMMVARGRHGEADSPEAKRADATRTLLLLPVTVPLGMLVYWFVGNDLVGTLTWGAMFAVMMGAALLLRRRLHSGDSDGDSERERADPVE
ncbi:MULTISPECIES: hypothetical protein [unclassified Pseudonocardia]|uniref:hypothetical protein n=1 Tax=unclassified Pseudonocardia TaxID=2619320 RepID=UPI0001FFEE7E|nr:hypothetical protein [Pseudonocardia sp. Ae707_Ps1]OLM19202.1 hypothetical protein Ae707Ps1_3461 [Pseudonocardia sp. Ae707_Ps1]